MGAYNMKFIYLPIWNLAAFFWNASILYSGLNFLKIIKPRI
jgi:hypothetical protein